MGVADLAPSDEVPPNKKAKTAQQGPGKKDKGDVATAEQQEGMVFFLPSRSTRSTVANIPVLRTNASSIANQHHDTNDDVIDVVENDPTKVIKHCYNVSKSDMLALASSECTGN